MGARCRQVRIACLSSGGLLQRPGSGQAATAGLGMPIGAHQRAAARSSGHAAPAMQPSSLRGCGSPPNEQQVVYGIASSAWSSPRRHPPACGAGSAGCGAGLPFRRLCGVAVIPPVCLVPPSLRLSPPCPSITRPSASPPPLSTCVLCCLCHPLERMGSTQQPCGCSTAASTPHAAQNPAVQPQPTANTYSPREAFL